MKFIPYQRLTITTDIPKDEIVRRLRDRVGAPKPKNFVGIDNIFSGRLDNDRFTLILNTDYRNSWTPAITGKIAQKDHKTEIAVTLKSNPLVVLVTIVITVIGMYMLVCEIIDFRTFGGFDWLRLLFIIFPYGLCWFGFNLDADKSIEALIKITKGEIK